jgi:hypothetical protein
MLDIILSGEGVVKRLTIHVHYLLASRSSSMYRRASIENDYLKIFNKTYPASRPTWGIASLRQIMDFTPGYMDDRACRE